MSLYSSGGEQAAILRRLRSVELGKHKALLAALMRLSVNGGHFEHERTLAAPYRLLASVEEHVPGIAESVLTMPQFGAWADDCVRRLLPREPAAQAGGAPPAIPLDMDLGHLALFAVAAAIRAGLAFRIEVPLRDGTACLTGLGTARPGARDRWEWGVAWRSADGWCLRSSVSTVTIPVDLSPGPAWEPALWWQPADGEMDLSVQVDDADPFLDRYGAARVTVDRKGADDWRWLLDGAWALLSSGDPALAGLVAGTLRAMVPIVAPVPTLPVSATDASSFGAIGLSRPADAFSLAEILVHECQHSALGALLDMEPLVRAGTSERPFLAYAPWRDDPRPAGALLQGIAAHYGMGRFWRHQYRDGPETQRRRAAVEYARMRTMTARAVRTLTESGLLTEAGRDFLAEIRQEVGTWLNEPLPAVAQERAADLTTDHEARWRLAHLVPDPDGIRALAEAWARGDPPSSPPGRISAELRPGRLSALSTTARSHLLGLLFRLPDLLSSLLSGAGSRPDPADEALIHGENDAAADGYLARIAFRDDSDAWAGLAVVRRRTGPPEAAGLYAAWPELLRALHVEVRAQTDAEAEVGPALPDRLAAWLATPRS
ncbi:MAG TPA: HEXXH motif domain-containing protein [Trebonia sp.]|nr:HEXXH motif domain-containing protein [Trebonia sp.]